MKFVSVLNNLVKRGKLESVKHLEIVNLINQYLNHQDALRLVVETIGLTESWGEKRPTSGPLTLRSMPLLRKSSPREIH